MKDIDMIKVDELLKSISEKFNIDIMDLIKKIASKEADGFSLNKNHPYTHLYIGNGSKNISIEVVTLENEIKLKVPRSNFI